MKARMLLERAVTINPDFAAALACIAATHVIEYANDWAESPERSIQTGLGIAERAVQIDDEDPSAHVWLAVALFWHREHDRAFAEARRGISLAPNLAEGHLTLARIMIYTGDGAAAIKTIDAYMRLDPLYPDLTLYFLAEARISLGQLDDAVAALKQRLELNPNSETSYALLASCYGHLDRIDEGSSGLDGGPENCSRFFNRAATAHPTVQKPRDV